MYPPQSDRNVIDEDKAQIMTKQLLTELGLDIDTYSISNRYVWIYVLLLELVYIFVF